MEKTWSSCHSMLFIFWIGCSRLTMGPFGTFCVSLQFWTEFTHIVFCCCFRFVEFSQLNCMNMCTLLRTCFEWYKIEKVEVKFWQFIVNITIANTHTHLCYDQWNILTILRMSGILVQCLVYFFLCSFHQYTEQPKLGKVNVELPSPQNKIKTGNSYERKTKK